MSSESNTSSKSVRPFVTDLEPFFYGRPITYVDVGAYVGSVLAQILASSIRVRQAHLIEPNLESFAALRESLPDASQVNSVVCHNVALSASEGILHMHADGTMTRVVTDIAGIGDENGPPLFEVRSLTLDQLMKLQQVGHIDLLKIDVEGHELSVLDGAKTLLSEERIDVVYVEAGMNPEQSQQVYYRSIEDALREHGYQLFRIYEQTHEWPIDSPALRRVNLAFMSKAFADSHPYKLSRELARLRRERDQLAGRVSSLRDSNRQLEVQLKAASDVAATVAERATELVHVKNAKATAEAERDAFVGYADELEEGYLRLIRSTSWRITGPLRVAVRAPRRLAGKPDSGKYRLPRRPSLGTPRELVETGSTISTAARHTLALAKESDLAGLYELTRTLETSAATGSGRLSYSFALIAWAKKTSTFAFGARAADAILDRYHGRMHELRHALGAGTYHRLVTDAAVSYARIGRYSDARRLLDQAIAAGVAELLPMRAEVSWIHDPDQAAHDLEVALRKPAGRRANSLLRRHLLVNVLDRPREMPKDDPDDGEFRLVNAIRCVQDSRHREYRELINAFFEDNGLHGPLRPTDKPFSFDDLTSEGPAPRTKGGLVSVIMTTHNSAMTLHYAVQSILRQSYQNVELLIVDDCSTDQTRSLLADLVAADDRIRVILNDHNMGTYAAKNRAMEIARGDYMTFHDSDDWAHPERISSHVDAMEGDPGLMATRSTWIRVNPHGVIDFRRWQKRLVHPNPASLFVRSKAVDKVGYFDTVRFGADSEYWYRLQRVFGRRSVVSVKKCLAMGLHHDRSLTKSGLGGRDKEEYSAIRAAYQYSWLEWHARRERDALYLDAAPGERRFWAPPAMLAPGTANDATLSSLAMSYPGLDGDDGPPPFVFGISLAARGVAADWDLTKSLLGRTLRSVLSQSDGRWRAVVCGHDRPDIPELDDPRVSFLAADVKPPTSPKHYRRDKMWKRRLAAAALRDLGGGYFCPLDADDLVHADLVKHVREDDNRRGYTIAAGFVEDFANQRLAPVPGVWASSFDRVCGSSAVLYFGRGELPLSGESDGELYFNLFQSHAYWPVVAEEWGRPLDVVPFPAAVYVVNHSQNLSFGLQRVGDRVANIVASIERHAVPRHDKVLRDEFGQGDR